MLVETRLYFVLWPSLEEATRMAPKETKQVRIITEEIPREHHKKTCLFSTFCGNWLPFTPLKGQENEKACRVNRIALCLLSCTGDRELRLFFLRTQLRALRGTRFRKEILSCPFGFWPCHKSSARQTAFISESVFSHTHENGSTRWTLTLIPAPKILVGKYLPPKGNICHGNPPRLSK